MMEVGIFFGGVLVGMAATFFLCWADQCSA